MDDISIRKVGKTGRITLTRPKALNAMSYAMCIAIEDALDAWAIDDDVKMIVIDAEGQKAFCAGGDIAELYNTGIAKNYDYGRKFWADEYRMNAKMFEIDKPVASFMQGYTLGGGVGVGCHASHRIVGKTSRIAMPEVGIGLIPDVGGTYLLAHAPGRLGEYLGLTAAHMSAADAILAGFADYYIEEEQWPALIAQLEETGDWTCIDDLCTKQDAPQSHLVGKMGQINAEFAGESLRDVVNALRANTSDFASETLDLMAKNSPLAMGCALEIIHRVRNCTDIRMPLKQEYRFTYRAMEYGDFLEGIRAKIIDKDHTPKWQHDLTGVPDVAVSSMLMPLGDNKLTFEKGE